ncbi:hypothetical protein PALI_b0152 [Pseudoalteromonas aliena SW19]|uniref:Uncharacterized protein n=1 Tax=Pseudoalteromonas aliena SW19 TaxID=1314866 RepID=A0ABR9E3N2_9GAMM|nr:hypothetical protein [Pseudoalteromonas aliena SW19]
MLARKAKLLNFDVINISVRLYIALCIVDAQLAGVKSEAFEFRWNY